MRRPTSILLAASLLGAAGALVFSSGRSIAEFSGGGGNVPVDIVSSPRLDVSATTPPGTWLGVAADETGSRLTVEALGPAGGPLYITGNGGGAVIAELGQQTANLITNPNCTFGVPQITTIGTTAVQLPTLAESHAEPTTKWALLNLSTSRRVCCQALQSDGGVPDCVTKGYVALPGGGAISVDGQQAETIYCRAATGTAEVNVWESSCVQ